MQTVYEYPEEIFKVVLDGTGQEEVEVSSRVRRNEWHALCVAADIQQSNVTVYFVVDGQVSV